MAGFYNNYKITRSWENQQRALYQGVGEYGIPPLRPQLMNEADVPPFVGFNFARTCADPENHGIHFWVDDYQFIRVWNDPDRYVKMLSRFKYVVSPDFSGYDDFPKALRVYQQFRSMWLARYWQDYGVRVIPNIIWSGDDCPDGDFEWCMDGVPRGACIAISATGTFGDQYAKDSFVSGFNRAVSILKPTQILYHGPMHDGLELGGAKLFRNESFTQQMERRLKPDKTKRQEAETHEHLEPEK